MNIQELRRTFQFLGFALALTIAITGCKKSGGGGGAGGGGGGVTTVGGGDNSDPGGGSGGGGGGGGSGITPPTLIDILNGGVVNLADAQASFHATNVFNAQNAGDLNGDGWDDVVVGAPFVITGNGSSGAALVFYGPIDEKKNASDYDVRIQGELPSDSAGWSVAGVGDVTGDGNDDLLIGARDAKFAGVKRGRVYVVAGPITSNVDLFTQAQISYLGPAGESRMGGSVSAAGDINGDGNNDIIIGAYGADRAYVIYGPVGSGQDVDINTAADVIITGSGGSDLGYHVTSGDINGDGYSDAVVGAPKESLLLNDGGAVVVFYGSASLSGTKAYNTADVSYYSNTGTAARFGFRVDSGIDLNGDGKHDMIVGAPSQNKALVIHGGDTNGLKVAEMMADATINGVASSATGYGVALVGDVNGDGNQDIAIGAPTYDQGATMDAGQAYLFYGPVTGTKAVADADVTFNGSKFMGWAGYYISGLGDLDKDGKADLSIGSYMGEDNHLIYGGNLQ